VGGFQPRALFAYSVDTTNSAESLFNVIKFIICGGYRGTNLAHLLAMLVGDPRSVR
jgi:hypothetical protein